jgi:acyl-CoA oxidase
VLDQQVVRAALKSYRLLFSESEESTMQSLLPSSHYLRLLIPPTRSLPSFTEHDFRYPSTSILLLEWRAALIVEEHARTVDDSDASIYQRVAKAVTEAFIAAQIGEIINTLGSTGMKEREQIIVGKVYLLVSFVSAIPYNFFNVDHVQYLVTTVEAGLVDLLSFNVLHSSGGSRDPTRSLRMTIQKLCTELLPEAIGLSDAFGFTDWELDRCHFYITSL